MKKTTIKPEPLADVIRLVPRRAPVTVRIIVTGGTRVERALVAAELACAAESASPIHDASGPIDLRAELSDVADFHEALGEVLNWADVSVVI